MSITDELREWAHDAENEGVIFVDPDSPHSDIPELLGIADRIDEQHAEKLQLAFADGVNHAEADLNEFKATHIKGPVDADGIPWHLGDKVDGMVGSITYLTLGYIGWKFSLADPYTFNCENYRHAKPDTWERIIQDAVKLGYADYPTTHQEAELVERCKRLAGE